MAKDPWLDLGAVAAAAGVIGAAVRSVGPKVKTSRIMSRGDEDFLRGTMGRPGMEEPVSSAPIRLRRVEQTLALHTDSLSRIEVSLESITKMLTPNGGDTNNVGDVIQRMARQDGTWLSEETPARDRREGDTK